MNKKEEEEKKKKEEEIKQKNLLQNTLTNDELLPNINRSIETTDKLRMSRLKYPSLPNDLIPRLENINNKKEEKKIEIQKPILNYPLSAIGLLKSDFGNGYFLFGTATLIGPSVILTCAHNLYSPILKRKAQYMTFYMDLTNGKYLKDSQVEYFVYPDEFEIDNKGIYDYGICILKSNLGLIGGYLGFCIYDKENNHNGFYYGYVNSKKENYYESFRSHLEDYNIKGCNMELRLDSKEEYLVYVNDHSFNGQDGCPIFKIKENDINTYPSLPKFDVQIFALDCSYTRMELLYINKKKFKNSFVTNDKIQYDRNNRAIPITSHIYNQILRWINFYMVIKPKDLGDNLKMSVTSFRNEGADIPLNTNMLTMSNNDIIGKDVSMILNSYDLGLIRILDLSNNEINYEGIKMLVKQKKMCKNIIDLNLGENELGYKGCEELVKGDFKSLNKLDLSLNEIGVEGCKILSEKGDFSSVIDFNIARNDIMTKGISYLGKGTFYNVEKLNLEGNRINDDGALALTRGNMKKIIELNLASNKIGDDGIIFFSKCHLEKIKVLDLSWNNISSISIRNISLGIFPYLDKLKIDYNKLGVEGAYYIGEKPFIKFTELSIAHNDICTKGAEMLSTLCLTTLEYLNVSDNFICDLGLYFISNGTFNNLKKLDVSLNQITQAGVEHLSNAKFFNTLNDLNIEGNNLEDKGCQYIAYSKLKNILSLNLGINQLNSISIKHLSKGRLYFINRLILERNNLLSNGISYLMESKFITNLIELDISYNNIGDNGCLYLSNGSLTEIEILNLKNNQITNVGIQNLTKTTWNSLKNLNLEDNEISNEGIRILASGFIPNLKYLKLKGNNLTEEDIKIMKEGNLKMLDKELGLTFVNYSKINNSVIRFCLRHPDRRYFNRNVIEIS